VVGLSLTRHGSARRRWSAPLLVAALAGILGAGPASAAAPRDWLTPTLAASPESLAYATMAYHEGRGDMILFGGYNGAGIVSETWRYDETTWTKLSPAHQPSPRDDVAMGYDAKHAQLILFGGYVASGGPLGDTWRWTGTDWKQLSPKHHPGPRWGAAMTYDAARRQLVLFGGNGGTTEYNDTWVWTGSDWSKRSPAHRPSVRDSVAVAYDAKRKQVVLFGGFGATPNLAETWLWNGSDWKRVDPATNPPGRIGGRMAYDPGTRRTVLFGGTVFTGSFPIPGLADTWTWNGTTWSHPSPAHVPAGRSYSAMAYDPEAHGVLLFGGLSQITASDFGGTPLGDTRLYHAP